MKKLLLISVILVLAITLPSAAVQANGKGPNGKGVDDLRGRWDLEWVFNENPDEPPPPLILYIKDIEPSPDDSQVYFANGCMETTDSGVSMPLSLMAKHNAEDNSYDLRIISTVFPPPEFDQPFVIRFDGLFDVYGKGVSDDVAGGDFITERGGGVWAAEHHDRRRVKCPSVADFGIEFHGDVYVHQDRAYTPPRETMLLEGYTLIVSSAMRVETPDGGILTIPNYTDIFSPDVDFISFFRYLENIETSPTAGEPYAFVLLDALGQPIPGTEAADIWRGCQQGPTLNVTPSDEFEPSINLSWDPVAPAPGFDPYGDPQVGFHQISINPLEGGVSEYGSAGIGSTSHIVPWEPFEPGSAGTPDGSDFGVSLSELEDGLFQVTLEGYGESPPDSGGIGLECSVFDSREFLLMTKSGSEIEFIAPGAISGRVTNEAGEPLWGISVGVCQYDTEEPYCMGAETNFWGFYTIVGVPSGEYRVWASGEGWAQEFYNNTFDYNLAERVLVDPGETTPDIDFSLAQGGSISGTVYDAGGNPLVNIAVDIEQGGFGTCTDEAGNYTMEGVPIGSYIVVAGRDFCGPHNYHETSATVELTDAEPDIGGVDFYLDRSRSISGTVTDGINGEPIAGIAVDIEEGGYGACTDDSGYYTLEGLPLGAYNVVAGRDFCELHPYIEQTWFDVQVTEDDPNVAGIDFQLYTGGSISGRVVAELDGRPLASIRVNANLDGSDFGSSGLTDPDGYYTIPGLPPGIYWVNVTGEYGWLDQFYNDQTDPSDAELVPLAAGSDATGIDFSLTADDSIPDLAEFGEGETLLIAALMTSCWEDGSQDIYNAIQMALADYGPVHGFNIDHAYFDVGCGDPLGVKNAVDEVVHDFHYIGVIGPLFSMNTAVAAPTLETAGIVMISPSNTRVDLPDFGPTIFNRTVLEGDDTTVNDWDSRVSALASVASWEARYESTYGYYPNMFAKYAYDATMLLLTRLEQSSFHDGVNLTITRAVLAAAVRNTAGYVGVTGDITLDAATGNRVDSAP